MRYILLALVSLALAAEAGGLAAALYTISWGVPARLLLPHILGGAFSLSAYEGSALLGVVIFAVPVCASLHAAGLLPRKALLSTATLALIICSGAYFVKHPIGLSRIGGPPSFGEFVAYYACIIGIMTGAGWVVGRSYLVYLKHADPSSETGSPGVARSRRAGGFTLIEVLVCIAIIALLSSLLFPALAQAKRSAHAVDDINKLRQIYLAINLYQGGNEQAAPDSLSKLITTFLPAALLTTQLDSRQGQIRSEWPANVGADSFAIDLEYAKAVTPTMIGFAYLKPFSHRFPPGSSFEQLVEDPKVGMLTDPAVGGCRGECLFLNSPGSVPGEPAYNMRQFFVVRTDGSLARRTVPECHDGGLTYEMMFLFGRIGCETTGSGP